MYNEVLDIQVFSKDDWICRVLKQTPPIEQLSSNFLPVLPEFSMSDCSDADVVILDVPVSSVPLDIRSHCAARDPRIIVCDRSRGEDNELEDSGLLDVADDIWCAPLNEQRLAFYFGRLLKSIKQRKDLWLSQNYLDTVIDSIPDLVWFKDARGAHLKVNQSFCCLVGKTKEQCHNRGHYYIWDMNAEEYGKGEYVCLESEDIVMKARKTCVFDEKIKSKNGMLQFKTYKSPIFDEDGSLIGTCGVAHDVTDWRNASAEIDIILNSLDFPTVLVDAQDKFQMVNNAFTRVFGKVQEEVCGTDYAAWKNLALTVEGPAAGKTTKATYKHGSTISEMEIIEEPISDIFNQSLGRFCFFRDITRNAENLSGTMRWFVPFSSSRKE